MTGSSIYFDTAPFIYLLEGHPHYGPVVAQVIQQGVADGTAFSTSVLAVMEFGVKPLQLGRIDVLQEFDDLLRELSFVMQPVTLPIAGEAARLRAAFPFLKGLDALHISTAAALGCQQFLTNDRQLAKVPGLTTVLLSDWGKPN